ncbi:DUF4377 domain-containing protein [Apibacter raozihei]|uniref:DUF4377 domain-containing protein n=1 Tax=Apibacter raozihei TaxID=2500547 RepID=UPI000FE3332D|nr:DUF4377 domain-containing protein [Apibacter raozihei]
MKKTLFFPSMLLAILIIVVSCTTNRSVTYTVASEAIDCVGVAPQKCLLVKKGNTPNWEYMYSSIEGFDYVPGYEYVLKVNEIPVENTPADASSIRYVLIKEVSKTQKNSENLPLSVVNSKKEAYQWIGRVVDIENISTGRGAAAGKFPAVLVKIMVTSSSSVELKEGSIIYAEILKNPKVYPVIGREYVFKAQYIHPAHAKGIYLLETQVQDLVH